MFHGSSLYWGPNGRARPGVIPGHEFVGEIISIDSLLAEKESLKIGDHIVAEQLISCQVHCWFCKNGKNNKCDTLQIYGQKVNGSFADYMIFTKQSFLHKVPNGISPYIAVLAEPMAVSIHGLDRAQLDSNDTTVAVSGCGTIGLTLIAALRLYYPHIQIIALDIHSFKLEFARKIAGSHVHTMNLTQHSTTQIHNAIKTQCSERGGCDVFFECSGSPASIKFGFDIVRKCGKFVHIGICRESTVLAPWNYISAMKELTIIGSNLGKGCWPRAFDVLQSTDLSFLITHTLPLEEYQIGFDLVDNGDLSLKVVLDPNLTSLSKSNIININNTSNNNNNNSQNMTHSLTKPSPHLQPFKISGSYVLVTGSSRGIGYAIASMLSKRWAIVALHGTHLNSPSIFQQNSTLTMISLAQKLSSETGNKVIGVWGDLTSEEGARMISTQLRSGFGHDRLDVLICAAGGNIGEKVDTPSGGKPTHDTCLTITSDDAKLVMDRNFWSVHWTCQKFVPAMVNRKYGKVIIIGSTSATIGRSHGVIYTMAKSAIHQYTRCLAIEVRESGVQVNCVAPGPTLTERYKRNLGDKLDNSRISLEGQQDPRLNRYGNPDDTALVVVQLLEMEFVTGQILRVDGGDQMFSC